MPRPKPVCRTKLYNKIAQLEVCRTFSGRGMGINGTAQYIYIYTHIERLRNAAEIVLFEISNYITNLKHTASDMCTAHIICLKHNYLYRMLTYTNIYTAYNVYSKHTYILTA